jgi:aspartate racemase
MKVIGLIGGTSWESTKEYYKILNETVSRVKGGYHSAQILLYSVDFQEIRDLSESDNWPGLARMLIEIGRKLEAAGADLLLLCANTLHKVYEEVQETLNIPVLHIANALAKEVEEMGLSTIGLLGTKTTMQEEFYRGRLKNKFNLNTLVPELADQQIISDIIFKELTKGKILVGSRQRLINISEKLIAKGAQGIVLGCTELPLLIGASDLNVTIFDTLQIHAVAAVNFALRE